MEASGRKFLKNWSTFKVFIFLCNLLWFSCYSLVSRYHYDDLFRENQKIEAYSSWLYIWKFFKITCQMVPGYYFLVQQLGSCLFKKEIVPTKKCLFCKCIRVFKVYLDMAGHHSIRHFMHEHCKQSSSSNYFPILCLWKFLLRNISIASFINSVFACARYMPLL